MKHLLLTLTVVLMRLAAYSNGGSPEAPCTPTYDTIVNTICQGDTFYVGVLVFPNRVLLMIPLPTPVVAIVC